MDQAERERIRALRALAVSRGPSQACTIRRRHGYPESPGETERTRQAALATEPGSLLRFTHSNASCGDRAVIVSDGTRIWQESEGCIICRAASAVAVGILCRAGPDTVAPALDAMRGEGKDVADPELALLLSSVPAGRRRCLTLALDAAQELAASLTGR